VRKWTPCRGCLWRGRSARWCAGRRGGRGSGRREGVRRRPGPRSCWFGSRSPYAAGHAPRRSGWSLPLRWSPHSLTRWGPSTRSLGGRQSPVCSPGPLACVCWVLPCSAVDPGRTKAPSPLPLQPLLARRCSSWQRGVHRDGLLPLLGTTEGRRQIRAPRGTADRSGLRPGCQNPGGLHDNTEPARLVYGP
jgi:hypothetical protein